MKKLIILFFVLLIAKIGMAQYPVNNAQGSDSALVTNKGGYKTHLVNYGFADTTAANLNRISNYPFSQIATDNGDFYIRNITATGWNKINSSGTPGTGTVTSISQGWGITNTPNPIVSTGSIKVDSNAIKALSGWGGINIYNADGTITSTRTVNGGGNSLNFNNNSSFGAYGANFAGIYTPGSAFEMFPSYINLNTDSIVLGFNNGYIKPSTNEYQFGQFPSDSYVKQMTVSAGGGYNRYLVGTGGGNIVFGDTYNQGNNSALVVSDSTAELYYGSNLGIDGTLPSEIYFMVSGGNTGIGTATPDSNLTVQNGIHGRGAVRFSGLPTSGTYYKNVVSASDGTLFLRDTAASPSTPTWQQTLTAGSTLTGSNVIDVGSSNSLLFNNAGTFAAVSTNSAYMTTAASGNTSLFTTSVGQSYMSMSRNGRTSDIRVLGDSIQIRPSQSNLYIDSLNNNVGTKALRYNPTTGLVSYADTTTGGGGGVTTLAAIGSSPNANGATISGSTLNLEPASASFGGVVTTGTQIFAGIKTFPTPIFTTSAETPLLLGATTSGANLTLQSTSHGTKGKILFGTSAYDEVNNRLGIQQATPTSKLQINTDANSVTQSDANGILLANATAATVGLQSISPPIVMQGNGWKTTATAGSQDVRFKMDVLPVQGSTNPTATWQLSKSINGAAYTTPLSVASTGDVTVSNTVGSFIFSAGTQVQAIGGSTGGGSAIVYRTTDAGANVTPRFTSGASSVTAGVITTNIDPTNGFTIAAANGTRQIARAGINITNLGNTAGSESADLIFLTQSAGGAMTEKVRILSTGETGIGVTPTSALHTTSFATAYTGSAVDIALTAVHQVVALTVTGKTATLPTAVGISGRIYTIKLTASGTGTVATTSSQTIDGSTTYSLASQYKYVTVQSDNTNWNVIGNN